MKFKKLIGSFPPLNNNRLRNFRVVNPKPNAQGLPSQKLIDVEDKDLRCYIRFEETLKDLIPAGISGSATTKTLTYRALPLGNTDGEVGVQRIVFNDYSAARFDDSESKYALLTFDSADNDIHFPRLSGTEDQTFTFSFFYKNDPSFESGSDSTTQYFFAKSTPDASYTTNIEYECYFDKGTPGSYKIYLRLIGPGSSDHIQNAFSVPDDFAVNKWEHLTFTYDGGQDGADIKLYINGKENTDSYPGLRGIFKGMKRSATQLMIGTKYDTGTSYSNQLCGYMAEFMVFASHFDANEAYALYSAVARDYYLPRSGYITNPIRVILGERDSATGSYPTVARMGDERRTGEYNVFYDDTNTIVFDSPFATATITFNTLDENFSYRPELGTVIGITGSNSASNFEIISSNPLVGPTLTAGNVGVEFPFYNIAAETNTQGNQQLLTIRRAMNKDLVINFCDAVNNQNLGLKVKKISDNSVKLTQTKPGEAYNTPIVIVLPAGSDVVSVSQEQGQLLQIPNLVIPGINAPVSFSGGKDYTVNYPTKLHNQHSGYQQLGVATPNVLADINTHGESKSGISDVHITFTPGEDMGAFRDSYFPDYNTAFMNQGIDPNLYQGFSSKLKNKTVIRVPVVTDLETDLGYTSILGSATPSSDTSGNGQQLMAYMNFSTKRWEKIGHPFHVNNVPSANATVENLIANITSSCIGFGPFQLIATASDNTLTDATLYDSQYMRSIGSKIDSYGFPFSAQYHASDDRTVKASSIGITKPFLLEKITFDTTVKMNTFPYGYASGGARHLFNAGVCYPNPGGGSGNGSYIQNVFPTRVIIPTFFVLRQKKGNFSTEVIFDDQVGSLDPIKFQSNIPKTQIISPGAQPTYVDTTRELITFGQICLIASASQSLITAATSPKSLPFSTNDILNSGLSKEYNVVLNDQSAGAAYTGSIHMEMTVKMAQQYPRVHGFHFRGAGNKYKATLGNQRNSRSAGFLEESNRALFNGFGGKLTTASLLLPAEASSIDPVPANLPANQIDLTSPFLIMPEDDLILGWQYPVFGDSHDGNLGSGDIKWAYMTIGGGKLNFYGSQIRDGVEFHDTLNQPLTSDAIHESIHYDNPVVDQFDIETSYEYSGSYIARARGGDDNTSFFFNSRSGNNTRSNYFGHNISTVVEPHLSSSFNRFVNMTSNESYLDSYPPDPLVILSQLGAETVIDDNIFNISYSKGYGDGEESWNRIHPFAFTYNGPGGNTPNTPVPRGRKFDNFGIYFRTVAVNTIGSPTSKVYTNPAQIGKTYLGDINRNIYLSLYGTHTQSPSGSVKLLDQVQNPTIPGETNYFGSPHPVTGRKFELQGFKYGLINALPQKTCAVYRRDRYGQFRDMLEQRKFSVFRETVAAENDYNSPDSVYQDFPVQVYFVDENNDSFLGRYYTDISSIQEKLDSSPNFQSSNISNYCTSSLPYFDDDTPRNRSYPEEFVSFE